MRTRDTASLGLIHIDPEDRELRRVQAKLGEVMMRLELAEDLIE
jgi:hypothetical protein